MKKIVRRWKAMWRDTLILLNEFRWPLLIFIVAIVGGGFLYFAIAKAVGEPVQSQNEAIFIILTAAFLQPTGDFPKHIGLQLFHFIMPLVGIIILAQGLADFGSLLFNRRARSKEWEMAVASTMNNHIVLVGLGHLGFRVAQRLHQMGENVVVVEINLGTHTTAAAREMGIPVIHADARNPGAQDDAHTQHAPLLIHPTQQ